MKLILNNKKVFLTSNTKIEHKEKVDIILSPEFYWVRIFNIPVKHTSQVDKVIPNFFEDFIDEFIDEPSYKVIKIEENKFMCFAYDNKKILEIIKTAGINIMNVNKVYFAQTECMEYKIFCINDITFFYTFDKNILVKVPKNSFNSKINLIDNIQNINLSSHSVDIKFYKKIISTKQIYTILGVLVLISIINFFKAYEYSSLIKNIDLKKENVKKENNLPPSLVQTNAIINEKLKIVEKEVKKRKLLEYLISDKNNFKSLQVSSSGINLIFSGDNKVIINKLRLKKYKIISTDIVNGNLNVKVKL